MEGSLSTTPSLTSLNPLAVAEEKKRKTQHLIFVGVCIAAGILALGALVWMMTAIFSSGK